MTEEYNVIINGIEVNARYDEKNINEIFLPLLRDLTDLHRKNRRRVLAFLAAPPGAGKSTLASFLESLSSYADYTIQVRAEESMLRDRLVSRRIASGHASETAGEFVDFSDMYNASLCLNRSKKADLMLRTYADGSYEVMR